jgi:hypothetical protein
MGLPTLQSIIQSLTTLPHPAGGPSAPESEKPVPRSIVFKASLILLTSMLAGIATAAEQARSNHTDNPLLHPPAVHLQLSHSNKNNTNSVPGSDVASDDSGVVTDATASDDTPTASEVAASYAAAAAVSPVLNTLAGTPTPPSPPVVTTASQVSEPDHSADSPSPDQQPDPGQHQPPAGRLRTHVTFQA